MCTVSYIFSNNKIIITSNRDEKVVRPSAIAPQKYQINNQNIFYPKDPQAGGTWFSVSENGNVIVLLNGADKKHQIKEAYKKSRGLIVLDLISSKSPITKWEAFDLEGIEPFTIVLFQEGLLYQLRWNEVQKETLNLNPNQHYIWSSATLYSKEISEQRENLFQKFVDLGELSAEKSFQFHRHTNQDDSENGLVINRNNNLKTVSITQTILHKNQIEMVYFDMQQQTTANQTITIIK